jgi:hypothetical protein
LLNLKNSRINRIILSVLVPLIIALIIINVSLKTQSVHIGNSPILDTINIGIDSELEDEIIAVNTDNIFVPSMEDNSIVLDRVYFENIRVFNVRLNKEFELYTQYKNIDNLIDAELTRTYVDIRLSVTHNNEKVFLTQEIKALDLKKYFEKSYMTYEKDKNNRKSYWRDEFKLILSKDDNKSAYLILTFENDYFVSMYLSAN